MPQKPCKRSEPKSLFGAGFVSFTKLSPGPAGDITALAKQSQNLVGHKRISQPQQSPWTGLGEHQCLWQQDIAPHLCICHAPSHPRAWRCFPAQFCPNCCTQRALGHLCKPRATAFSFASPDWFSLHLILLSSSGVRKSSVCIKMAGSGPFMILPI